MQHVNGIIPGVLQAELIHNILKPYATYVSINFGIKTGNKLGKITVLR